LEPAVPVAAFALYDLVDVFVASSFYLYEHYCVL
jgi:hypothetical protein